MIAADTSVLVEFLAGGVGEDLEALAQALSQGDVVVPPMVITEIMSAQRPPATIVEIFQAMRVLWPSDGYWERAGRLRARLLRQRVKGRLADALIAQSCLDYDVPLLTRDRDFRHFAQYGGLKLIQA